MSGHFYTTGSSFTVYFMFLISKLSVACQFIYLKALLCIIIFHFFVENKIFDQNFENLKILLLFLLYQNLSIVHKTEHFLGNTSLDS